MRENTWPSQGEANSGQGWRRFSRELFPSSEGREAAPTPCVAVRNYGNCTESKAASHSGGRRRLKWRALRAPPSSSCPASSWSFALTDSPSPGAPRPPGPAARPFHPPGILPIPGNSLDRERLHQDCFKFSPLKKKKKRRGGGEEEGYLVAKSLANE